MRKKTVLILITAILLVGAFAPTIAADPPKFLSVEMDDHTWGGDFQAAQPPIWWDIGLLILRTVQYVV